MADLVRTGLSLERELLEKSDETIARRGYQNRSEAIRDLIREHLVSEEGDQNKVIAGTLTMVYDHHRPNLSARLTGIQHSALRKCWLRHTCTWTITTVWRLSS